MAPEFNPHTIKLIIGLGNPDEPYQNTYHNVGHHAVQSLLATNPPPSFSLSPRGLFSYVREREKIFAVTEVAMNNSGEAVKEVLKQFHLKPEEILVCHDDTDLLLGEFQIAFEKGPAGHRGIISLVDTIHTRAFWRLRIGIRAPHEQKRKKAGDFVLHKISPNALRLLTVTFEKIAEKLL